jgi:hypothetical protein
MSKDKLVDEIEHFSSLKQVSGKATAKHPVHSEYALLSKSGSLEMYFLESH